MSLFRSGDINAPRPPFYATQPNPQFGHIRQIASDGRQSTNGLEFAFGGNLTQYFSGTALYAYSQTYNNTSGIYWFPANSYDLAPERGRASFDQRHRAAFLGSIDAGKGFHSRLGLDVRSGAPVDETTWQDENRDGLANNRLPGVRRDTLRGSGYVSLHLHLARDFFLSKRKEEGPLVSLALGGFYGSM